MKQNITHGFHWLAILVLLIAFVALIAYGEAGLLAKFISTDKDINEEWLPFFLIVAFIDLGCAFLAVTLWYSWGTWLASFKKCQGFGKRLVWVTFFLILIGVVVVSIIITTAEGGVWLAHICYAFNVLGFYYLATVFCSPLSLKYYPFGAKYLRRW